VPIAESIRGFKEILEGKHDDLPERAFIIKDTIDQVVQESGRSEGGRRSEGREDEAGEQSEGGRRSKGREDEEGERE